MGRRSSSVNQAVDEDVDAVAAMEANFAAENAPGSDGETSNSVEENGSQSDVVSDSGVSEVVSTRSRGRRSSSTSSDDEISEVVLQQAEAAANDAGDADPETVTETREEEMRRVARELAENPNLRSVLNEDGEIEVPNLEIIEAIAAAQAAGHDYEPDADAVKADDVLSPPDTDISPELLVDSSSDEFGMTDKVAEVENPEVENPDLLEFEEPEGIDPLHQEILNLLSTPRKQMQDESYRDILDLNDEKSRIEGEQAHREELRKAMLDQAGRGQMSVGGAIGGLVNSAIQGVSAMTQGFRSPEGVLKRDAKKVNQALFNKRDFRSRVIDRQYGTLVESVDGLYRTAREYEGAVNDFNKKFSESETGKSFLRGLEHVAGKTGVDVSDIQARMLDSDDADPIIGKLRSRQNKLLSDPEFAGDMAKLNSMVANMSMQADRMTDTMSTLKENGAKMPDLEKFSEKLIEGLKLPEPILQQDDGEKKDKLKKAVEELSKKIQEFIQNLIASLTGKRSFGDTPYPAV